MSSPSDSDMTPLLCFEVSMIKIGQKYRQKSDPDKVAEIDWVQESKNSFGGRVGFYADWAKDGYMYKCIDSFLAHYTLET